MSEPKVKVIMGAAEDDLGAMLHTALRKCCDSTTSSLLWNIVHLAGDGWREYLALLWKQMEKANPNDIPAAVACLKAAGEELSWGTSQRAALKCAFELLTEDDWNGMADYLEPEKPL